jgi:FG-GAP repeat
MQSRWVMKALSTIFTIIALPLYASTGTQSEVAFTPGTGVLSTASNPVAVGETYILVGLPSASFAKSSGGPTIVGAGEVQVFNKATGALVRKLRSPAPSTSAAFGRSVCIQGNRAFILDLNTRVNAVDIPTGKTLWQHKPSEGGGSSQVQYGVVDSLAVDGGVLLAGMSKAWWIEYPLLNFYKEQGLVARMDVTTGAIFPGLSAPTGEEAAGFGSSVAIASPLMVVGEPNRDESGLSNSGRVVIFFDASTRYAIAAPTPAAEDRFGAAVAIAQQWVLVGAPGYDGAGKPSVGRVYVFDKATHALVKELAAPAALPAGAGFGGSLSASFGPMVVIGANGTTWLYDVATDQLAVLGAFNPSIAGYGRSGVIYGSTAVVIDPTATGGSAQTGRVFRYSNVGRGWGDAQLVAKTKSAAPQAGTGTLFSGFGQTAASTMGDVMQVGTMNGGGTTAATDTGIWSTLSGMPELLIREGDSYVTHKLAAPTAPNFTPEGRGIFLARFVGSKEQNVLFDDGNTVTNVLSEQADILTNGGWERVNKLLDVVSCPMAAGNATVAYTAKLGFANVTASNDSRIGTRNASLLKDEAREGAASPVVGLNYGQINPRVAGNGGRVAFVAALSSAPTTSNSVLVAKTTGMNDAKVVARKGDPAPGASNAKFSSFVSETLNSSAVVFRAALSGGASGVTSGVWKGIFQGANSLVTPLAIRMDQAPGTAVGVKFSRFLNLYISDAGAIAIRAQVTGTGVTTSNDVGVWVIANGQMSLVLREGSYVGGGRGAKVASIQQFALGSSGHYAALVSLSGVSAVTNQALLTGSVLGNHTTLWLPEVAAQKGTLIDLPSPSLLKGLSLAANHLDSTGAGTKGNAQLTSTHGVVFTATFADHAELRFGRP